MIPFLKEHERLILGILLLALILFLGNKWMNYSAAQASAQVATTQKALEDQKRQNDDLAKQQQQQQQAYQQILATVTAQNAALTQSIVARNQQTVAQQKTDQVLPLPDLAVRWETLLGLGSPEIQNINGNLVVSDSASRATVQQLETVPTLKQNLADQQKITADEEQQVSSLTAWNLTLQQQTAGLNTQIVDDNKNCQAQINDLKEKGRKSKRNWFVGGLVAGAAIVAKLVM